MAQTDIRVLGPQVQRAVEGVIEEKWELNDDQVRDLTADALAQVLLYSGSVFGLSLVVTHRDPVTQAPDEYATSDALTLQQTAVIAAEAALTYFYHRFKDQKVSEQISDEASHWEYALSPSLLVAQLKLLQDQRDKALEAIQSQLSGLEGYISFLAERDRQTSRYVEPWVYGISDSFGGIGGGGLELDPRFDTFPGLSSEYP